jgi:hypothetical protein
VAAERHAKILATVYLLFDGQSYGLRYCFRIRTWVESRYLYGRRRDFRILRDGKYV